MSGFFASAAVPITVVVCLAACAVTFAVMKALITRGNIGAYYWGLTLAYLPCCYALNQTTGNFGVALFLASVAMGVVFGLIIKDRT